MAVLGSRDQMCIKNEVKSAPSGAKTGMCKALVRKDKCEYFKNQERFNI